MRFCGSIVIKRLIQLIFVLAATFVGLSRISDYKHFYTDVLGGMVLGSLVAYVICFHTCRMFKKTECLKLDQKVYNVETGLKV